MDGKLSTMKLFSNIEISKLLPTGLGQEFDDFINALSVLEQDAPRQKLEGPAVLSAIRKMLMDKLTDKQVATFDWDRIFPDAADVKVPDAWVGVKELAEAASVVRKTGIVRIGPRRVDVKYLLAGLEARLRESSVKSPDDKLTLGTSLEIASFHGTIAQSVFAYMQSGFAFTEKNSREAGQPLLDAYYSGISGNDKLNAFADAWNIDLKKGEYVFLNLLNYYGDTEKVEHSMTAFAEKIGFGKLSKGVFENDSKEFRQNQAQKVLGASFLIGLDTDKREEIEKIMSEGAVNDLYKEYMINVEYTMDKFADMMAVMVDMEYHIPSIVSWNRLEPRPRTNNFRRVLRAEVRDALWMLSRQWQMGEFAAEDAGTSVEMRIDIGTSEVGKYSLHKKAAHNYDKKQPLEAIVERDVVNPDLTMRLEMGKHWLRMVKAKLVADPTPIAPTAITTVLNDYLSAGSLRFVLPTPASGHPDIYSDPLMLQWYAAIKGGRAIDGNVLYRAFKSGTQASSFLSAPAPAINAVVNSAANDFVAWFERTYSQPSTATDVAWDPSHLEYQFHCSSPNATGPNTVLAADEYASGHLDWYSFDIETSVPQHHGSLLGGPSAGLTGRRLITVLPSDVQFPGMPRARWWLFEDYKVDLGGIKADTSEPAKLLLAEFALIYSNDWMLVPFTIEAGNICSVQSIVVKDVFGQFTQVQAAGAGNSTDWQRWTMFNLKRRNYGGSAADTRLFVPPVAVTVMESDAIESVNFLRDEMANLVWGVETFIADGRGGSKEGWEAGRKLFNYLESITVAPPVAPPVGNNATVKYELGTPVPEHWIPFIPVRMGSVTSREIQLRRAAMPRIIPGRAVERVRPRTSLLRTGYNASTNTWDPYFVFEEEVLRSGCIVESTWQRTRWTDGSVVTWLGKRKYVGKGEADSGLEYDTVKPVEATP
jgi:hypothetical protein